MHGGWKPSILKRLPRKMKEQRVPREQSICNFGAISNFVVLSFLHRQCVTTRSYINFGKSDSTWAYDTRDAHTGT